MDNINDIKSRLARTYNEAIGKYNNGDYDFFLLNIRRAIEAFCKLVIYDLVGQELASDLLSGEKTVTCDFKTCRATITGASNKEVQNSLLPSLAHRTIYYIKGGTLALCTTETKIKRIKNAIDSDFKKLISDFSASSQFGSHDNNSVEDQAIEARDVATFLPKVFKHLKQILSDETIRFLEALDKPTSDVIPSIPTSENVLTTNNDFFVLDEITGRFEQEPGVNYVAFLPAILTDKFGKGISNVQMQDFFRLKWDFIVDLNQKTSDGLFEQVTPAKKPSIRVITDKTNEISGVSNLINWMFARGRTDLSPYSDKKALRDSPKLFSDIFSKVVRTGQTNDYIIFDFCDSFPQLSIRLFDKIEDVFGSWDTAKSRCRIVSFTRDVEYKEKLNEWGEISEISIDFVDASFGEFLNHLTSILPSTEVSSSPRLLVRGNSKDLTESRERYRAAGIEFYGPTKVVESRKWDFYSGAEITWDELDKQFDVQRDLYRSVKQRVSEIIRTTRRTQVYTLLHRPGSGATTFSRRLAYDIKKEDEAGVISCTVIDIKNCSNIRLTEQYLGQLSEEIDNIPILAIVEAKRVGREKFENLVKRMADAAKKVVFFYIEPFTRRYHSPRENVVMLNSFLRNDERSRFEEKYRQLGLSNKLLTESLKVRQELEVIDFPLMLRDKETSDNLSSYVKEWLEILPDELKTFCAYVSFVFKYSDFGVNQTLLKPIWIAANHTSLSLYDKECQNAIKNLLIEESTESGELTGIWRPRYNRFSEFILSAYKMNWRSGLSDFAKSFIHMCQETGELGSDDKDMLYSIFIIRKNADYRAVEDKDNIKNKFSLLIKDLEDIERAETLFSSLVNAFPNDALFRGHFARFLYEKATMTKGIDVDDRLFIHAQEQLDIAFELNPDDSDLHHMQGMLYRRRIKALSQQLGQELKENPDDVDLQEVEDCLVEWTDSAYAAFETSIKYSPASPYGYAAESQLFKEAIVFGKRIHNAENYSFCETNSIYSEYVEKLGDVLDLFEQICYAFKNDGLSQIMNSLPIYENVRLFHQNIIGQNQESIQRLRNKYASASGEKKKLYGSFLFYAIIYNKTKSLDIRKAYINLTKSEKKEIEDVLEDQKNRGHVKSYETLFMLKLYSHEEFSLDNAIDLLKEWENQYAGNDQNGWGLLNACFYLAVCYCAKAIQESVHNKELSSLAMAYFKKSEDIAKRFEKGTIQPQCYFGERQDIHCIVDKFRKDVDATTITGVIYSIKNNKGILRMQCGIDVTFNAKGFDIIRDEGQILRGVLGFSYSGPGLYDFRPDQDPELSGIAIGIQEEKEISIEDLGKSYVPIEDLIEESNEASKDGIENNHMQFPKVVDKIEIRNDGRKRFRTNNPPKGNNQEYIGEYKKSINSIIENDSGFKYELRSTLEPLYDGAEVIFEKEEDQTRPRYMWAINVRIKD